MDLLDGFLALTLPWRMAVAALVFPIGVCAMIYAMWLLHNLLGRLSVSHARRPCRRMGLMVQRSRWQPELDSSGTKREFTLVQLDCLDARQQRRLVLFSAWLFGVRILISDEAYPPGYDLEWPLAEPSE